MVKSDDHNRKPNAVKSGTSGRIKHKHNRKKRPSTAPNESNKITITNSRFSSGNNEHKSLSTGHGADISHGLNQSSIPHSILQEGRVGGTLSLLQQKFSKKLDGARFRVINEKLYTSRGDEAFQLFQSDPEQFHIYHKGFREQSSAWPYNPLDGIIAWIRSEHKLAVVADMGCGDARLASSVSNKVHSFDLVASNPAVPVVACDIAHVPLQDSSVDIVVFCLALMGTNVYDFIREAYRILRPQGIIRIAEVRSRFEGKGQLHTASKLRKRFVPSLIWLLPS